MLTQKTFREIALSFPGAEEMPHFDKSSFRFRKKIFATLRETENTAMIRLPLADQSVFCSYDKLMFWPVAGTWGKQGYTFVDLKRVKKQVLTEVLIIAWQHIQQK